MDQKAQAGAPAGLAGLKSDEDPPPQASEESPAALAAYISDMAAELAKLAARAGLPMLAHFLSLAHVEAQIHARELGYRGRARGGR